jgi:hypothetical protein
MVDDTPEGRIERLEVELRVAQKAYATDMAKARKLRRKDPATAWKMAFGASVLLVQSAHRLNAAKREASGAAAPETKKAAHEAASVSGGTDRRDREDAALPQAV